MVEAIAENAESTEEALKELRQKQQELEQRLSKLKRPRSLSPEEEREIQQVKKQKLAIKDKMSSLREKL